MKTYNADKVDEVVLALLQLTLHDERGIPRAWKGFDWDTLNRLHHKNLIGNPRSKSKSVVLTEQGLIRSAELFEKHFGVP